jgi:transcriptional regulator with XRE-family HTH domain
MHQAGDKVEYKIAFEKLGERYRKVRLERKMVQEDVLAHGFSVRHYQQLESGRQHSLKTFFRVAKMFNMDPEVLIKGIFNARRSK